MPAGPEELPLLQVKPRRLSKKVERKAQRLDAGFLKLKGLKVIQYHRTYNYLFNRYGVETAGTLEPLPGIPPTARHLERLKREAGDRGVKFVVLEGFRRGERGAEALAQTIKAKVLVLPQDVGVEGAKDLFALFDEILRRLSQ